MGEDLSECPGEPSRQKTQVAPDYYRLMGLANFPQIARHTLCHPAHIAECEIFSDHSSPAASAKLNHLLHLL